MWCTSCWCSAVVGANDAGAVDATGCAKAVRGVVGTLEAVRGVASALEVCGADAARENPVGNIRDMFDCVGAGDADRALDRGSDLIVADSFS